MASALRRRAGLLVFLGLSLAVAGWFVASRLGALDRLSARLFPSLRPRFSLSPGDFPAGVTAPGAEIASIPLRPTSIGLTPRGSAAALLLATGGATPPGTAPPAPGLFRTGYALEVRAVVFEREEDLRSALAVGGERGGVDLAAMSVDRLVAWSGALRDAAPRVELLLGRSRGQDALAAVGVKQIPDLKGKRLGVDAQSPAYYFALWLLTRGGLAPADVRWVDLASPFEAGAALREGRVDAAVGLLGDIEPAARERGGQVIATTADAPHLIATVLVARGEFAARYPDAVRRTVRGLLDAGNAVLKDPGPAARLLGEVAPSLGDPAEAIRGAPPATYKENLAFFGLAGEAPVTYDELFHSAADLFARLGQLSPPPPPEETRDLSALRSVAEARSP